MQTRESRLTAPGSRPQRAGHGGWPNHASGCSRAGRCPTCKCRLFTLSGRGPPVRQTERVRTSGGFEAASRDWPRSLRPRIVGNLPCSLRTARPAFAAQPDRKAQNPRISLSPFRQLSFRPHVSWFGTNTAGNNEPEKLAGRKTLITSLSRGEIWKEAL